MEFGWTFCVSYGRINYIVFSSTLRTRWYLPFIDISQGLSVHYLYWYAYDLQSHSLVTVYPKKYANGFVVLCFVVVMQSFIMNSYEVLIHIHQGCFAGTGAIVRLPQCQWSKPDGYGKISQCITTTKHSKAKTVCIFFGIYCTWFIRESGPQQSIHFLQDSADFICTVYPILLWSETRACITKKYPR